MTDSDDAKRWRLVKSIFYEAIAKPPDERDSFLDVATEDDSIRSEVRRMLELEPEVSGFIEKPAATSLRNEATSPAGKEFGRYRIIREIGHGGMGAVFLAERIGAEFEQKVALKIMRQTISDALIERRFRRERQILAALSHPYIARLIDGDVTERGELFLVMEYVDGADIVNHARRNALSTNERLKLFLKVCDAVAAAHRNLIVHLDLKPSNILVTAEGLPKLLDFGLSRIIESDSAGAEAAMTEFRAFTPGYSAPEQILGRAVSVGADVYSLGIVLFELLSGSKPFSLEGRSLDEIIATLSQGNPVPPSRIATGANAPSGAEVTASEKIKPDLDNIVLKAISYDPADRYLSVEEFAADIGRFLDGRPVSARPASVFYTTGKFLRRNRLAVAASAIVAVSLLTGAGMTLRQMNETRRERDRAEKRFSDLRKLSNSLLFDIAPRLERLEGSTEAREKVVSNALEYLDSLAAESDGDPDLQRELAEAYIQIGEIQGNPGRPNLNDAAGAASSFEKAIVILARLPQTTEVLQKTAVSLRLLAKSRQSDSAGSIRDAENAIAIYERMAGGADSIETETAKIEALTELAQIHTSNSDFKSALAVTERALSAFETLGQPTPRTRELSIFARTQRAFALSWESRQKEAEELMAAAVADAEKLADEFPVDSRIKQVLWESYFRSSAIYETIRDDVSLEFANKCVALKRRAVERDPLDVQSKQNLARSYSRVALALANLGRTAAAIESSREAERILNELLGSNPRNNAYRNDLAALSYRVGLLEKKQGKLIAAAFSLEKARESYAELLRIDPENLNLARHVGIAHKHLGDVFAGLRKPIEARNNLIAAQEVFRRLDSEGRLPEYDRKKLDEIEESLRNLRD